jgi:6-pyruvoyltetrahydropterin/6-carboxytetrahydropterin synthase
MRAYKVVVEKDYLVFAAGHFITYDNQCEALHGHNYRVRVELEGDLDENTYVFDFVELKRIMRRLVDEIDHKMLLPLENRHLTVSEEGKGIRVAYRDREYLFPREDVVLLPIPNTTAEMLATHLAGRLKKELAARGAENLTALAVEVEESFGQSAWYREELRGAS